jgi:hypothetical protein
MLLHSFERSLRRYYQISNFESMDFALNPLTPSLSPLGRGEG